MLKLTIEVKENKDNDTCTVTIINPKDVSKATDNEKNVGAVVRNEIEKAIQNLQN